MLLFDSPTQQKHAQGKQLEKTRQLTSEALARRILADSEMLIPDGIADVTSEEQQRGQELTIEEFKARLLRCNPNFIFEVSISYPELMGIYMMLPDKQYQGAVNYFPKVPEFTTMKYKITQHPKCDGSGEWEEHREATGISRGGWRRVLALFLHKGFITAADVYREFPDCTRDSRNWKAVT